MTIQCRPIISAEEVEALVDLHGPIWSTDDREAIPAHILIAIQHAGGLVLGAFDGSRAVGFSVGFPGIRDGESLFWSHATGVLPEYQGQGIGLRLKWLQRRLVLERGYNCIAWTYDPLQRGNANLNIRLLGCECNLYHVNFYGTMRDELNMGLPSDRFEVRWWLESERVQQRQRGLPPAVPEIGHLFCALSKQADGGSGDVLWPSGVSQVLVEIPEEINGLRKEQPDLALRWRLQTREAFMGLFADGFSVADFVSQGQGGQKHCRYLLARHEQ
jgi:predicted GNAT superfamily acetyltransferase